MDDSGLDDTATGKKVALAQRRIPRREAPRIRLDAINHFSTGRSGSYGIAASSSASDGCDGVSGSGWRSLISRASAYDRRMRPVEEQPRDRQSDPDDESEQADGVNQGQSADPLRAEAFEVGRHPDGEEGHGE